MLKSINTLSFKLIIGKNEIKQTDYVRYSDIFLNDQLNWKHQIVKNKWHFL